MSRPSQGECVYMIGVAWRSNSSGISWCGEGKALLHFRDRMLPSPLETCNQWLKAAWFPWSTLSSPSAPFYSISDRTALSSSIPTAKGRRSKPAKQMGTGKWLKASISPTRSQQPHQQNVMGGLRQYGEETTAGGLSLPLFSLRD